MTDISGLLIIRLTLLPPLVATGIDQANRVGRSDHQPRPIIVKLISYQTRKRIFYARGKLKDEPSLQIYINEDLSPIPLQISADEEKRVS